MHSKSLAQYRYPDQNQETQRQNFDRGMIADKIADGASPYGVSQQGLLQQREPDTVYNWMNIYASEGVEGLIAHQQGGSRRGFL